MELKDCKTQADVLAWLNGQTEIDMMGGAGNEALTRMAEIARDEALEEAAKAMRPMLRNMISRGDAADRIRILKTKYVGCV